MLTGIGFGIAIENSSNPLRCNSLHIKNHQDGRGSDFDQNQIGSLNLSGYFEEIPSSYS